MEGTAKVLAALAHEINVKFLTSTIKKVRDNCQTLSKNHCQFSYKTGTNNKQEGERGNSYDKNDFVILDHL